MYKNYQIDKLIRNSINDYEVETYEWKLVAISDIQTLSMAKRLAIKIYLENSTIVDVVCHGVRFRIGEEHLVNKFG